MHPVYMAWIELAHGSSSPFPPSIPDWYNFRNNDRMEELMLVLDDAKFPLVFRNASKTRYILR